MAGSEEAKVGEPAWTKIGETGGKIGETEELRAPRSIKDIYASLINKRIVIQEKGGVVLIGLFASYDEGFFKLKEVTVKGRGGVIKNLTRVWVDRGAVAHIHEEIEN